MPETKKKRTGLLSPPMTAGLGIAGLGGLGALTARAVDYHPEARQHVADAFARMNATNDPVERLVNYLDMGRAQNMPTYGKATGLDLMQNAFTHGTALNSIGQKFHERFKKDWNEPIHYGGGQYTAPFSDHYTIAAQGPIQNLANISKEVHAPKFHGEVVQQLIKNVPVHTDALTNEQQLDAVRKTLQGNPAAAEGLDRAFSPHGQEYDLLSRVLAAPGEAAHAAGQASPYLIGGGLGLAGAAGIYKLYKHLAAKKKLNSSSAAEHSMTPKLAADLRILEAGGLAAHQLLVKRAAFGPRIKQADLGQMFKDYIATPAGNAAGRVKDYMAQTMAQPIVQAGINEAKKTWNDNPALQYGVYGAGIGGALGLGSHLLGGKKKKINAEGEEEDDNSGSALGSMLGGAALGAGLGAGGKYLYDNPGVIGLGPKKAVGHRMGGDLYDARNVPDSTTKTAEDPNIMSHPAVQGGLYGAGIGGLLGLGSEAISGKKKKDYLDSVLSGGTLGGLVGGAGGYLMNNLGENTEPKIKQTTPMPGSAPKTPEEQAKADAAKIDATATTAAQNDTLRETAGKATGWTAPVQAFGAAVQADPVKAIRAGALNTIGNPAGTAGAGLGATAAVAHLANKDIRQTGVNRLAGDARFFRPDFTKDNPLTAEAEDLLLRHGKTPLTDEILQRYLRQGTGTPGSALHSNPLYKDMSPAEVEKAVASMRNQYGTGPLAKSRMFGQVGTPRLIADAPKTLIGRLINSRPIAYAGRALAGGAVGSLLGNLATPEWSTKAQQGVVQDAYTQSRDVLGQQIQALMADPVKWNALPPGQREQLIKTQKNLK